MKSFDIGMLRNLDPKKKAFTKPATLWGHIMQNKKGGHVTSNIKLLGKIKSYAATRTQTSSLFFTKHNSTNHVWCAK